MQFKYLGVIAAILFSGLAHSQALYQEGLEYLRLREPLPTDSGGKVEVIEFFSYACPHCNEFEPDMVAWRKKLPPDVHLKLVPVAFNQGWRAVAQGYYAAEQLGVVDKLHEKMFAAIHKERKPFSTPEQVADIAASVGIDRDKFLKAMNSSYVSKKIDQSMQLLRGYGVQSVPTLAVNGKFVTHRSPGETNAQVLATVDYLVGQELAAAANEKTEKPKSAKKANTNDAGKK